MAKVLERSLYQTDYYAWTKQQAAELRRLAAARVNTTLDLENLAEEVESLGRSDLNTVRSQVRRIIEHLLKLEYSPSVPATHRLALLRWFRPAMRSRTTSRRACVPTCRRPRQALRARPTRCCLGARQARRARGGAGAARGLPLRLRSDRQPRLVPGQPPRHPRRRRGRLSGDACQSDRRARPRIRLRRLPVRRRGVAFALAAVVHKKVAKACGNLVEA